MRAVNLAVINRTVQTLDMVPLRQINHTPQSRHIFREANVQLFMRLKKPPACAGSSVRPTKLRAALLLLATLLSTLTGLLARLLVRLLVRLAGLIVALLAGIIILVHHELLGVRVQKPTSRKGTRSLQFAAPYNMPQQRDRTR
jgi:hypothetical protein